MIQVTDYRGDAAELATFTNEVWLHNYRGKTFYPEWDASYFEWQLFDPAAADRVQRLAAYDGDRR